MLWIRSVVLAAKKPPNVVYATMITALPIIAGMYGISNKVPNSFPHAANPDAVYGTKKITMISAETPKSIFPLS